VGRPYGSPDWDGKQTDIYPAVNRIYVEIMDIKQSQTQEEARQLGALSAGA